MNVLHAHLWGKPWTLGMGIYRMNPNMCEKLSLLMRRGDPEGVETELTALWAFVEKWIQKNGPCFFRASGASPKDSTVQYQPLLKAHTPHQVFDVCFNSLRFEEELDHAAVLDGMALVLTKWDDEIVKGDEYRILVVDGEYEVAIRTPDGEVAKDWVAQALRKFVDKYADRLPAPTLAMDVAFSHSLGKVTFIEHNPIDDELDTYGIDTTVLSHDLQTALQLQSETYKALYIIQS
jgi:hypothetical protein